MVACPAREELRRYLTQDDSLGPELIEQIAEHIETCPSCQELLDGLTAVHSMMGVIHRGGRSVAFTDADVEVVHPVVLVHPETGRKALYVNESWTIRICELDPAESAHVLYVQFRQP